MGLFNHKTDRGAVARLAVETYWGESNGGFLALATAEDCLRESKLKIEQIRTLRTNLPLGCQGTTGQKVAKIDRILKRLEHEAK